MRKVLREIFNTALYLLMIVIVTYLIVTYVGQRTVVNGASMEPTLIGASETDPDQVADNLIVDKLSYRFRDPERFDIIVFPFHGTDVIYIKRIIGLPGETIRISEDGIIYIKQEGADWEVLEEGYGKEVIQNPGRAIEPITLGEDEYFVLGDNRNNSADSRTQAVGNIHRDEIIGKAWIRIWPFSRFGVLEHQ